MVKVVVAGGSGSVAREVIDRILEKNIHEVTALTRQTPPKAVDARIDWIQVDYADKNSLVAALSGADVALAFFSPREGSDIVNAQKNLIDACVEAGVKRFAPSEWGPRSGSSAMGLPFYSFKDEIRQYLEDLNSERPVLEYCLFQPGFFTNYFGFPYSTTKHFIMNPMYLDFESRRAIVVGDGDYPLALTTVQDMAGVVAEAVDFNGVWPTVGGIRASQTTVAELIELGKRLRGSMQVDEVSLDDLRAGELNASWYPLMEYPGFSEDQIRVISKSGTVSFVRSAAEGAWNVSAEWNDLLPHYKFVTADEYLTKIWEKHE